VGLIASPIPGVLEDGGLQPDRVALDANIDTTDPAEEQNVAGPLTPILDKHPRPGEATPFADSRRIVLLDTRNGRAERGGESDCNH
jgi:hypothetical protein